eukprot:SAG11_NODE_10057_length_860_cov_1.442838_1_plen_106_part_00
MRKRRTAKKHQPTMMDGDCVLAVPGDTITANAAGTLLPAIQFAHFFFFSKTEIYSVQAELNSLDLQYCTVYYCTCTCGTSRHVQLSTYNTRSTGTEFLVPVRTRQ